MRISVWKQSEPRARWRRIGVLEANLLGAWPFNRYVPYGTDGQPKRWPRFAYYTMEEPWPSLFPPTVAP